MKKAELLKIYERRAELELLVQCRNHMQSPSDPEKRIKSDAEGRLLRDRLTLMNRECDTALKQWNDAGQPE